MSEKRLPGAERYLTPKVEVDRFADQDARVNLANDATDLRALLNEAGCTIPEGVQKSWKDRCPFGAEHADGGLDKAMRYYPDSNSAYCFAAHGILTPVRMVAMMDGISNKRAADMLLGRAGVTTHRGWRDRIVALQDDIEHRQQTATRAFAITALQMRLKARPTYLVRQYDDDMRQALEAALERLEATPASFDAFNQWVDETFEALDAML